MLALGLCLALLAPAWATAPSDALASVLRQQIAAGPGGIAFVSINGADPSAEVLERLRDLPVQVASRAWIGADGTVRDARTGQAGTLYYVSGARREGDAWQVGVGYYRQMDRANASICRVQREGDHWRIGEARLVSETAPDDRP
jgi:hypothetical protein